MSKYFLIMEVKEYHAGGIDCHGRKLYHSVDGSDVAACYVHPSHIIDGDRLRYGRPGPGDFGFYVGDGIKLNKWTAFQSESRLIIDPPPSPKTDLDRVLDQAPSCIGSEARAWIRDRLMPFLQKKE